MKRSPGGVAPEIFFIVCTHQRNPLIHGADAALVLSMTLAQAQRSDDLLETPRPCDSSLVETSNL